MKNANDEIPRDPDPIPELGYDEPLWTTSQFQEACVEFANAFLGSELSPEDYVFGSENHVSIPLLSADKVNSEPTLYLPDEATHFGMLIGPQGFAQTAWMSEQHIWRSGNAFYLRHPAELMELQKVHSEGPFSTTRSKIPGNIYSSENEELMKALTRLCFIDTPTYEDELDPPYRKHRLNLSDIIEEVFVLLEQEPFAGRLLSLAQLDSIANGSKLLAILQTTFDLTWRGCGNLGPPYLSMADTVTDPDPWEGDLTEFHRLATQIAKNFAGELPHVSFHDVVLGYRFDLSSVQLLGTLHNYSKAAPKFILRPNRSNVSLLRFLDLLTTNVDIRDVVAALAGWRKKVRGQKVEIEQSLLDQIRASISFRHMICRYSIHANFKSYDALRTFYGGDTCPPPYPSLDAHERRIHSLYEAYPDFYESGYKQLLAAPEPRLPHFLEIAYQRFLDSSSERSLSANARNFLNLLGRTLLFFMLEDVGAKGLSNKESKAITDELRSNKPPSDGRLLDMQLRLIRSLPDEMRDSLVTENLMKYLPEIIKNHLRPVVTKRNRANHPPFDETGFIEEARKQFAPAVAVLRKAFRTLELLVPVHFTSKEGQITVRAQSLTGRRFEYPERDFFTMLGHEETPCDSLLLCRVLPNQSQPPKPGRSPAAVVSELLAREQGPVDEALIERVRRSVKASFDYQEKMEQRFAPRIFGAVPLETFFHKKSGYKEILMTGVFDRISKDGPVFDYVEETN